LETECNLPLGFDPQEVYREIGYQLAPGDRLTLLTDGVPEAAHGRELFGFERTSALSRESASLIADTARNFGQTDDITVLTIDVLPPRDTKAPDKPVYLVERSDLSPQPLR
jgi:sigma-B regulation protein RsbU (phosphoserine phosphatase)